MGNDEATFESMVNIALNGEGHDIKRLAEILRLFHFQRSSEIGIPFARSEPVSITQNSSFQNTSNEGSSDFRSYRDWSYVSLK